MSMNTIVVAENPRGRFKEGVLKTATAKPGQCVKLNAVSGVNSDPFADGASVRSYDVVPGYAGEVAVLTEKGLVGGAEGDTYAVNDGVHYYLPLPGEEFYALGLSGETLNVGTRASFDADGKLVADVDGSIICMDAGGTLAADTLLQVRVGHTTTATAS